MFALDRIIGLTAVYLKKTNPENFKNAKSDAEYFQIAKDYLHKNPTANFVLEDHICQKKFGAIIQKPAQAYKMYRKIVKYFATKVLMEYCTSLNENSLSVDIATGKYYYDLDVKDVSTSVDDGVRAFFGAIENIGELRR